MPKIILGKPPATFKHKVTFPLVEGGEDEITVEYKYRTRAQFASFMAGLYPDIKSGPNLLVEPGFDMVAAAKKSIDSDVQYILGAVHGWDLDDQFNADSARRLADEFPAAAGAIMAGYRIAITEGRLGN
jgi:hypothetical protein